MKTNFNITNKLKIWGIITLALIIAGMFVFGFVGYNKAIDYKDAYEIQVKVYSIDDDAEKAKETTEKYFDDKYISYKSYATRVGEDSDGFKVLTYKVNEDVTEILNAEELKTAIKTAIGENKIPAEVTVYESKGSENNETGYIALALGLAVVAIFIYLFFMEKLVSSLATIISMVISVLLLISVASIVRVPMYPFNEVTVATTAILTVMLSAGLVSRFREEIKNVANAKKSSYEIANIVANASILRYIVVFTAILIASVLLIALGSGYLKFLGIQLFISGVVSIFSSLIWTPTLWALMKKDIKSYNQKEAKIEE